MGAGWMGRLGGGFMPPEWGAVRENPNNPGCLRFVLRGFRPESSLPGVPGTSSMGFGKDGKGVIIRETVILTIGNLAANAVVKHTAGLTLVEDFRIIKTEYFITQTGIWGAVGDEVIIGICNGELSVTEIAETLNLDGPGNRNNAVANERAMRAVWPLIQLKGESTTIISQPSNDGKINEHVLRWTFNNPEGWSWFAYNPLTGALTSGAIFSVKCKYFGVWLQ